MKKKRIFLLIFIFILSAFWLFDYLRAADYVPVTPSDLSAYAQKEELTVEDYAYLLHQTGLGKVAIDTLRQSPDCHLKLQTFQEQLAELSDFQRVYLFFPTTTAEVLKNQEGKADAVKLPELLPGDVLITRSTKTLLYRHGHAAIVIDGEGTLAESMMLGTDSIESDAVDWASYATLMILRPKDREVGQKAAVFAKEQLLGVPYSLLAGIGTKDYSQKESVTKTHCSHLVWQAYKAAGLDLDSDDGSLVTPCDIAGSDELELVFCYGFGETMSW